LIRVFVCSMSGCDSPNCESKISLRILAEVIIRKQLIATLLQLTHGCLCVFLSASFHLRLAFADDRSFSFFRDRSKMTHEKAKSNEEQERKRRNRQSFDSSRAAYLQKGRKRQIRACRKVMLEKRHTTAENVSLNSGQYLLHSSSFFLHMWLVPNARVFHHLSFISRLVHCNSLESATNTPFFKRCLFSLRIIFFKINESFQGLRHTRKSSSVPPRTVESACR
jgi:hypothetical protein